MGEFLHVDCLDGIRNGVRPQHIVVGASDNGHVNMPNMKKLIKTIFNRIMECLHNGSYATLEIIYMIIMQPPPLKDSGDTVSPAAHVSLNIGAVSMNFFRGSVFEKGGARGGC